MTIREFCNLYSDIGFPQNDDHINKLLFFIKSNRIGFAPISLGGINTKYCVYRLKMIIRR